MADNLFNVLIVNGRKEYFEYVVTDISTALDRYIEEVLGFEKNFSATEYFWSRVKDTVSILDDKVRLVNGFCKRDRYKISKVILRYTNAYPICVTFTELDGVKIYLDGRKINDEIAVHYADNLVLHVAAAMGYELVGEPVLAGGYSNSKWDAETQLLSLYNITDQVTTSIATNKLPSDWLIRQITIPDSSGEYKFYFLNNYEHNRAYITNGEEYQNKVIPITRQYIPKVCVLKDGVDVSARVYTFDYKQWEGSINLNKDELNGHFCIKVGTDVYDATYRFIVNMLTNDGTSCEVFLDDLQNNSNLKHWQNLSITNLSTKILAPAGWKIDQINVTMDDTDVTSSAYSTETDDFNIANVIGNVVVTAIIRPMTDEERKEAGLD